MQFDKQEIVDLLRKEGKNEHVQKALQELPDKVDHERHAQMLQKFGIDPGKLVEKAAEKELGTPRCGCYQAACLRSQNGLAQLERRRVRRRPILEFELVGEWRRFRGAYGIRTRAAAVRGRCPRPLDECAGRGRSVAMIGPNSATDPLAAIPLSPRLTHSTQSDSVTLE